MAILTLLFGGTNSLLDVRGSSAYFEVRAWPGHRCLESLTLFQRVAFELMLLVLKKIAGTECGCCSVRNS